MKSLSHTPSEIWELIDLQKYIEAIPLLIHEITAMIKLSTEYYELLDKYLLNFRDEDLMEKLYVNTQARNIVDLRDKKEVDNENKKKVFLEQLRDE